MFNKIIILLSLLFLIFSSSTSYGAKDEISCIITGVDIAKTGLTSIAVRVTDNGYCTNYKFYELSTGSFSLRSDDSKLRLTKPPIIDPYSRSKIHSVIARDNDIVFNFDYPFIAERFIENDRYIFIIKPAPNIRLIANKPVTNLTAIRCDKSLPAINITTDVTPKFAYGLIDDNISYLDLYDVSLLDDASTTKDCKSEVAYAYLDNPTRLRIVLTSGRYKKMLPYLKDDQNIIITPHTQDNIIYITKMLFKSDNGVDSLDLFISSGVVTNIIEVSKQEFAIEIDDNSAKINNLSYERRFSDSYIKSLSKQRLGVKDRLVIRVEPDVKTKIDKTENGFTVTVTK